MKQNMHVSVSYDNIFYGNVNMFIFLATSYYENKVKHAL